MSRKVLLTDDLIRQALAPSPGSAAPVGLVDGIAAGIRRTSQRRTVADRLGVAAPALPSLHLELADRRLGWLLAAAILAALALAAAAVGAWLFRDTSEIRLVPSGVDVLAPDTGYSQTVLDGTGVGWAVGPGHVTRFDPATGEHRTWTVADDAAFAGTDRTPVAGAKAGGIWMLTGSGLVRFDGSVFHGPLMLPMPGSEPTAVDESPDGSLWVAFSEGVFRWDGARWAFFPGADACSTLVATGPDEAWAVCRRAVPRVLHLADGSWEGFEPLDERALGGLGAAAMAEGPDGSIWIAQARYGLAHWVDGRFVDLEGPDFPPDDLQVTMDGDVWIAGEGRVARRVGGAWQEVDPPGAEGSEWLAGIAAVGTDLVLATSASIYRYDGSGWAPLWTELSVGPSHPVWSGGPLEAVSADEVWFADQDGVWHYIDGRWVGPERPVDMAADSFIHSIHDLAVGPDGSVAIATSDGVAVRGDADWTWRWRQASSTVDVAPDGSFWALSGVRIVHLVETDGRPSTTTAECREWGSSMAVAVDGSVWVGQGGGWGFGGLSRYDGSSCRDVDLPGPTDVAAVQADPTGGVVIMVPGAGAGISDDLSHYTVLRSDGGEWSTLRELLVSGYAADVMVVGGDGRVWVADVATVAGDGQPARLEPGIKRYEDGAWRTVTTADMGSRLSVAPDGTLWLVGSSGIERIDADQLR